MDFASEIVEEIRAGMPGIHILSDEYLRLDTLVYKAAECLGFDVKEWSMGTGQINSETGAPIKNDGRNRTISEFLDDVADCGLENKLLYIKNAKIALENNKENIAKLQYSLIKIQQGFKKKSCVVYCSEVKFISPELEKLVYFKRLPPPGSDEMSKIIDNYISENDYNINDELKNIFSAYCAGLTEETVLYLLSKIFHGNKKSLCEDDLEIVRKVKEQNISKTGYIEMMPLKENFDDIGGMENIKNYLQRKKIIIDDMSNALENGIIPPKGIMLAGMPGCGKSLSAKAAAALFKVPLLRIDMGSLMGKYVGESENNLKNALYIAEQTSPCVLWIDEVEKAFSGINSDSGGGVTSRMFGAFLTWMQEKTGTIFVIATANDMDSIPPELWRKGRFDEVFFVNLPNKNECEQILEINLRKIKNKDNNINISKISERLFNDGFSGADINALVNEAAESSFIDKKKLTAGYIESTIKEIVPLKKMLGEKIKTYEEKYKLFKLKPASLTLDDEDKIVELYKTGKIHGDDLIIKFSKFRHTKNFLSLFTILDYNSPVDDGIVRTIKIHDNEVVYVNFRAVEIETPSGRVCSVPIKKNGIIKEVCISRGQKIKRGEILFKVFVPTGGNFNDS
jgi:ATP-dependent 26S proteasome regulatory subunit